MPWKETNVNEERMKFVVAWKQGGWSLTDLCKEFGISRPTRGWSRFRGPDGVHCTLPPSWPGNSAMLQSNC